MAKYRKKPIVIEAEIYREGLEDGFGEPDISFFTPSEDGLHTHNYGTTPYINTLEGRHYIRPGDYIITGIQGERYPCKSDIFEATYELVDESEAK